MEPKWKKRRREREKEKMARGLHKLRSICIAAWVLLLIYGLARVGSYVRAEDAQVQGAAVMAPISLKASIPATDLSAAEQYNSSQAKLKEYVESQITVKAEITAGNWETIAPQSVVLTEKTVNWSIKGTTAVYIVALEEYTELTCELEVTVHPVNASAAALSPMKKKPRPADGYPDYGSIGLPEYAAVTFQGTGYSQRTDDTLPINWTTPIPDGFGKTSGAAVTFSGNITGIPEYATITDTTVTTEVTILDKTDISSSLTATIPEWTYGEPAGTPAAIAGTGVVINPACFSFTYSGMSYGGTSLTDSVTPPVLAGEYTLKAVYEDDAQTGFCETRFVIHKKKITPSLSAAGVSKLYDGNVSITGTQPVILFSAQAIGSDVIMASASFSYDTKRLGSNKTILADNIILKPEHPANSNYELLTDTASVQGGEIHIRDSQSSLELAIKDLRSEINLSSIASEDQVLLNLLVQEVRSLPTTRKKAMEADAIRQLGEMQEKASGGIMEPVDTTPKQEDVPKPEAVEVYGMATAADPSFGEKVKVYVTPVKPSDQDVLMELELKMTVEGAQKSLFAPLAIIMKLPSAIDVSSLVITHVSSGGHENMSFISLGDKKITIVLDSFSSLRFSQKKIPPASSSEQSSSESEKEKEEKYWEELKDTIRNAAKHESLTTNTHDYYKMPTYVMDALRSKKTISLKVKWNDGKTFTIPAGEAHPRDDSVDYFRLAYLEDYYNNPEEKASSKAPPQSVSKPPAAGSDVQPVGTQENILPPQLVPSPSVTQSKAGTNSTVRPKKSSGSSEKVEPRSDDLTQSEEEQSISVQQTQSVGQTDSVIETPDNSEQATEVLAPGMADKENFCLIDLLTGKRTEFGCYWCFIPIVILFSALGIALVCWQEKVNHEKIQKA